MKNLLLVITFFLLLSFKAYAGDTPSNKLKSNPSELILDCRTEGGSYIENKYYPMNSFNILLKINLQDGSFSGEHLSVLAPFLNDMDRPKFEVKDSEFILNSNKSGQIYSHEYKLRLNRLNGRGTSELKTQYLEKDGRLKLSRNEYRLDCTRIIQRKF
jgi:hypothetical protein